MGLPISGGAPSYKHQNLSNHIAHWHLPARFFLADIANGIGPRMPAVKRMLLKKNSANRDRL